MNGYQQRAITGGIGNGINTAVSGILNHYGLQQRLDLQKSQLDIQKQNSATYHRMMHYNLVSRFERDAGADLSKQYHNLFRRTSASKGLVVVFEDGTIHGGGKAKREVLEHTRRKVEVTFEDAEPGPTMKKGNGHG